MFNGKDYLFYDFQKKRILKLNSGGGEIDEVAPFMCPFESRMKVDSNDPENLLISDSMHMLYLLNTKSKESFEIGKDCGERIFDYLSLPKNRILMLTEDGYLILKSVDAKRKKSNLLNVKKIRFEKVQGKSTEKMVYCPEEGLIAVCINVYTHLSRILVFKIQKDKVILKSTIDFRNLNLNYLEALSFHKPKGRYIALSGFSNYKKSKLYTLVLDKRSFKLLNLKEKITDLHHPSELHRIGDALCGVDDKGVKFEVRL